MFNCLRNKETDKEIRRQSLKDRKQSLEARIGLIREILDAKYELVNRLLDARTMDIRTMIREGSEITEKLTRLRELEDELVEVVKQQEALES